MRQGRIVVVGMVVGVSGMLLVAPWSFSAEHGGQAPAGTTTKEHGGATQEHGGTTHEHGGATQEHGGEAVQAEPSAEQIRQAIRDNITLIEQEEGAFTIEDDATGATRTLQLVQVHERVGKTGELYYSCTDMMDVDSKELLDLDFDVDASGEELEVVDVRIHKLNGQPRYTYDDNDNRVPLNATNSASSQ